MPQDTILQYVIRAKDEASKTVDSFREKLSKNAKGFQEFGIKAGLVGGAIAGALGLAVKSAVEAEEQMAKVNTILGTMGQKGQEAKSGILAAADAATKLGFDDEEAAQSVARLFQRTGDLTEATKLNAIAMDLSRARNMGLLEASNMVGMVMSGNGRILKQYGIDLKETGTPMEALDELQKKLAGSAANYADTFAGSMQVFKVQMGNMQETIGGALLPVLTDLMKRLQPIIEATATWIAANPELVKTIVEVTAGGAALLLSLTAVSGALSAIAFALSPTGIVVLALVALAALVVVVIQHWDELKQTFEDFATILWNNVGPAINGIISDLKTLADWATRAFNAVKTVTGGGIAESIGATLRKATTKKRQSGGMAGGLTVVGERGPEAVLLPGGSRVMEAGATRRMGGGGASVVNVSAPIIGTVFVANEADERRLAARIEESFARIIRGQQLKAA